ncbi:hypothetical protein FVEG_15948 [Fusarium verticillioides 7600]|uniref:Uncharacterized protein n=1 Tax=Gibberella moniliformis (strain M3125 / FGSC 7600) TaxID=334819 RepID=W7M5N1_GIBM7|nr:hypothetical protein FVEG_15948 [Fusarium verticillioides 7600]EWG46316.1 hypothetical protein FVEG_15948 [Fusarium verticillioides 7600]
MREARCKCLRSSVQRRSFTHEKSISDKVCTSPGIAQPRIIPLDRDHVKMAVVSMQSISSEQSAPNRLGISALSRQRCNLSTHQTWQAARQRGITSIAGSDMA